MTLILALTATYRAFSEARRKVAPPSALLGRIESLIVAELVQQLGGHVSTVIVSAASSSDSGNPGSLGKLLLAATFVSTATLEVGGSQRGHFVHALQSVVSAPDAFRGLRRSLQSLLDVAEPIALEQSLCSVDGLPISSRPLRHSDPAYRPDVDETAVDPNEENIFSFPPDGQFVEIFEAVEAPQQSPLPSMVAALSHSQRPTNRRLELSQADQQREAAAAPTQRVPRGDVDNSFGFIHLAARSPSPTAPPPFTAPTFLGATVVADTMDRPHDHGRREAPFVQEVREGPFIQEKPLSRPLSSAKQFVEAFVQTDPAPAQACAQVQTDVMFVIPEAIDLERETKGGPHDDEQSSATSSDPVRASTSEPSLAPRQASTLAAVPVAAPPFRDQAPGDRFAQLAHQDEPSLRSLLPSSSRDPSTQDEDAEALRPRDHCPNPASYPSVADRHFAEPEVENGWNSAVNHTIVEEQAVPGITDTKAAFELRLDSRDMMLLVNGMMDILRDAVRLDVLAALKGQEVRLSDIVVSHKTQPDRNNASSGAAADTYSVRFEISVRAADRLSLVVAYVLSALFRVPDALAGLRQLLVTAVDDGKASSRWAIDRTSFTVNNIKLDHSTSIHQTKYVVPRRNSNSLPTASLTASSTTPQLLPDESLLSKPTPPPHSPRKEQLEQPWIQAEQGPAAPRVSPDPKPLRDARARAESPQPTPPPRTAACAIDTALQPPLTVNTIEHMLRNAASASSKKAMTTVRTVVTLNPLVTFKVLKEAIKQDQVAKGNSSSSLAGGAGGGVAEELLKCLHFDLVETLSTRCGEGDYINVRFLVPPASSSSRVPMRFEASIAVRGNDAALELVQHVAHYLVSSSALPCAFDYLIEHVLPRNIAAMMIDGMPRVDATNTFVNDQPVKAFL